MIAPKFRVPDRVRDDGKRKWQDLPFFKTMPLKNAAKNPMTML
jgi:hypothetical protein